MNAAVFYDLSLLNLIIPSKKNLEIGLGLVNVVTLGELKAVLAHEFGHFAQRSMAVGRWVYISQQIAGHIVARRDALDKLLQQLSRIDLRVAWVGWVLSIIVWSIRSMMDVLFRVVLLAQRALSRQMEFQADLVAVSLTGSDALIHALHKLSAADDAWDKTLSFANTEAGSKRGITDLFAVQSRVIERMREILNQPMYGSVPPLPDTARDSHRVFKTELAQPPRMWGTHPPSCGSRTQRQTTLRRRAGRRTQRLGSLPESAGPSGSSMSAHVYRNATVDPTPMEKTFRASRKAVRPRIPESRVSRRVSATVHRSGTPRPWTPSMERRLRPANLTARTRFAVPRRSRAEGRAPQRKARREARARQRYATRSRRRRAASSATTATEIRRTDLPRAIAALEREITAVRGEIEAHDKLCRSAHLSAAQDSRRKAGPNTCARSRRCCTTRTTPKRTCVTCRDTSPTSITWSRPTDA